MILQLFSTPEIGEPHSCGFLRILRGGKVLYDPCFRPFMVDKVLPNGETVNAGTQRHAEWLAVKLGTGTFTSIDVSGDTWDEPYTIINPDKVRR